MSPDYIALFIWNFQGFISIAYIHEESGMTCIIYNRGLLYSVLNTVFFTKEHEFQYA